MKPDIKLLLRLSAMLNKYANGGGRVCVAGIKHADRIAYADLVVMFPRQICIYPDAVPAKNGRKAWRIEIRAKEITDFIQRQKQSPEYEIALAEHKIKEQKNAQNYALKKKKRANKINKEGLTLSGIRREYHALFDENGNCKNLKREQELTNLENALMMRGKI